MPKLQILVGVINFFGHNMEFPEKNAAHQNFSSHAKAAQ